jgi:putative transposase
MSYIPVKQIAGLSVVPSHRTSVTKWLSRNGISSTMLPCNGGNAEHVLLTDPPEDVRRAYLLKHIDGLDLEPGTYDDEAHAAFLAVSKDRRARAERKAEVARFLLALPKGTKWPDRLRLVHAKFGVEGHSKPCLKALLTGLKGVDPINFALALLDGYVNARPRTDIHCKAWSLFLTLIRDAAPEWPLVAAWRDVRDIAPKMGWGAAPSYATFWRRWNELPEAQRLQARLGTGEARKRLTQPIMRDKTSISPLEWVSLDGRTKDFWVDAGDGRAVRWRRISFWVGTWWPARTPATPCA